MSMESLKKPIENERELEFAVFCIENVAARLGKPRKDFGRGFYSRP